MSTTPIFDQLCQELGDVTEPEATVEAIGIGPDALAEPDLEAAPNPEEEETVAEWSAPESEGRRDAVHWFEELPAGGQEH
ncbi:MAG: hypothetical protein ACRDTF_20070 [Pseudonocardiaceae bacterium]